MKAKKVNGNSLTMADFEKGLVLAGLLSPRNLQELEEVEALKEFDSQKKEAVSKVIPLSKKEPKNMYFRRAVLAAEIVHNLHKEPTFGRIKFQKLFYLCEHAVFLHVQQKYQKQAAGPFDRKFMHSIVHEFKRQNWFIVENVKSGQYNRSVYMPLDGCLKFKEYYSRYFQQEDSVIQGILKKFKKKDSKFTEISATLFFCFHEMKDEGYPFNEKELLRRFYNWSERKTMFTEKSVLDNWNWMITEQLVIIP